MMFELNLNLLPQRGEPFCQALSCVAPYLTNPQNEMVEMNVEPDKELPERREYSFSSREIPKMNAQYFTPKPMAVKSIFYSRSL